MQSLDGKVAVVTGAGSGIGQALARKLSEAGARLALNDREPEGLGQTAESLATDVFFEDFDVSDRERMDAFAGKVQDRFGQVDILINNAGMTLPMTSLEYTLEEDFRRVLEVNLWGVIYGTMAFLPFLKTREEASIVNISSVFGLMGYPLQGPYSVSKFAVRGFTETLRIEMKDSPIAITSVHPGGVKTNIARHVEGMEKEKHEDFIQKFDKAAKTSAEDAADIILEGIRKKKVRVLIGSDARTIDRTVRLLPSRYEDILLRKFRLKE